LSYSAASFSAMRGSNSSESECSRPLVAFRPLLDLFRSASVTPLLPLASMVLSWWKIASGAGQQVKNWSRHGARAAKGRDGSSHNSQSKTVHDIAAAAFETPAGVR
jgi:hypothetical protein